MFIKSSSLQENVMETSLERLDSGGSKMGTGISPIARPILLQ